MTIILPILGILALLLASWAISVNRMKVNARTCLLAFALQFAIGALLLYAPVGKPFLIGLAKSLQSGIGFSQAGIDFIFGPLGSDAQGFIFAFRVLPVLVFFSSLVGVLYYIGILQYVIRIVGSGFQKLIGTSQAESCAAVSNVMLGGTEVYLLVRPYLHKMTDSELFALMVGASATMSPALLLTYSQLGVDSGYLLAAIFMSAPGGLLIAKLMVPETGQPEAVDLHAHYEEDGDQPTNVIDAATKGAISGAQMAFSIGAMLLALISLVAFSNGILGGVGGLVGVPSLSLEMILGYLLAPVAYLLGIPGEDVVAAGALLGKKIVLNEFVAYVDFAKQLAAFDTRSQAVLTIARAGFANLATPASLFGVLAVMVPERRPLIAKLAIRVIVAATIANFISAGIASILLGMG